MNAKPVQPASLSFEQQTLTIPQAMELAMQYHGEGHLFKAESIYQQIVQAVPNQPIPIYLLGVIASQVGNNDKAEELIAKAIEINPDTAEAHNNLGIALSKLGWPDEAITHFHSAINLEPDYAFAHNNLGNSLKELGRLDEAITHYRNAINFKPDYAVAYNNVGSAFFELERFDEAVTHYRKAISFNPDYTGAHFNLGIALTELGHLDDAVASYRKVLANAPDHIQAHYNSGYLLNALKRHEDAFIHFNKNTTLSRAKILNELESMPDKFITKHKIKHDIEQYRYLAALGREAEYFSEAADEYESLYAEINWSGGDGFFGPLTDNQRQRLRDVYFHPNHLVEADRVSGSSLNKNLDISQITSGYFGNHQGDGRG